MKIEDLKVGDVFYAKENESPSGFSGPVIQRYEVVFVNPTGHEVCVWIDGPPTGDKAGQLKIIGSFRCAWKTELDAWSYMVDDLEAMARTASVRWRACMRKEGAVPAFHVALSGDAQEVK